jgi:hypothetical protein
MYFNVVGQHLIYLNDYETTINLFEKRSSIYSDRIQTRGYRELSPSQNWLAALMVSDPDR